LYIISFKYKITTILKMNFEQIIVNESLLIKDLLENESTLPIDIMQDLYEIE
jgi:hypothetical protein